MHLYARGNSLSRQRVQSARSAMRNLFRAHATQFAANLPRLEIRPPSTEVAVGLTLPQDFSGDFEKIYGERESIERVLIYTREIY